MRQEDITMYSLSFLVLTLAALCQAQVPFLGRCPANVTPKTNFDGTQYLGKWYEQEKYFAIFQLGGKCTTATYTSIPNGVGVLNKQLNIFTGSPTVIQGTAVFKGPPTEGRLEVSFPSVPNPAPYWVLDTDYTNYAVVYACNDFTFFNIKFTWILTRSRSPEVSVMQSAYSVLDRFGISRAFLLRTDQTKCPADN